MFSMDAPAPEAQNPPTISIPVPQEWRQGEVRVQYESVETEFVRGAGGTRMRLRFEGDVIVTWQQSELRANTVVYDELTGDLSAQGQVRLTDPDGHIEAESLQWNTITRSGRAEDALFRVQATTFQAKVLEAEAGHYRAQGVTFWLAREGRPPVYVSADRVSINDGRTVRVSGMSLHLYGVRLGPWPSWSFRLDRRTEGLRLPRIVPSNEGLGYAWGSEYLINDQTVLDGYIEALTNEPIRSGLRVTYSLDKESANVRQLPTDDLGERVHNGWFNSVDIKSAEHERGEVSADRNLVSAGIFANRRTFGRENNADRVNQWFRLDYTRSEEIQGWGANFSASYQRTQPAPGSPSVDRLLTQVTMLAPTYDFGGGWKSHVRGDLFNTVGGNQFGFVRGEVGTYRQFGGGLTAGVAVAASSEYGTPDFNFDRLYSRGGLLVRLDYERGPYTGRYLAKWDEGRGGWYDQEYELAMVANVFEPFLLYRRYPGEFRFGVRLRMDAFRDTVRRRIEE